MSSNEKRKRNAKNSPAKRQKRQRRRRPDEQILINLPEVSSSGDHLRTYQEDIRRQDSMDYHRNDYERLFYSKDED